MSRLFKNTLVSFTARGIGSGIQFLSLPVLLRVYGKDEYGLIVLAMSLNTFIAILQMGLPTGIPKFVAEWLARNERPQLNAATRTITSFYIGIGTLNLLVLVCVALFKTDLFQVEPSQFATLKTLLVITAFTSFAAIPISALDQLLTGAQEIAFLSKLDIVANLMFGGLVATIVLHPQALSLSGFYLLRCVLMFLTVPLKIWRWRVYGPLSALIPGWDFLACVPLLKFCLSIMVFAVFGMLAEALRPVVLGMRVDSDAGRAVADYQIINNVRIFLMMIVTTLMTTLVPHISSAAANGNSEIYRETIVNGTRYMWWLCGLIGFGIMMLSKEFILAYVGADSLYLTSWLVVLVSGALYNLYVTPIVSVILSSGRMKPMIYATGVASAASILFCWFASPRYGVGAAAIALVIYNCVHFLVTHVWYLPKYFDVNFLAQVWGVMLPPVITGVVMCLLGRFIVDWANFSNSYCSILLGAVAGTLVYGIIAFSFFIRPAEIRNLVLCSTSFNKSAVPQQRGTFLF